jgi:hypothetical protein
VGDTIRAGAPPPPLCVRPPSCAGTLAGDTGPRPAHQQVWWLEGAIRDRVGFDVALSFACHVRRTETSPPPPRPASPADAVTSILASLTRLRAHAPTAADGDAAPMLVALTRARARGADPSGPPGVDPADATVSASLRRLRARHERLANGP